MSPEVALCPGPIDWATTAAVIAAVGAWASAVATSGAVFIAARLSERTLRLGVARERLRKLDILQALVEQARALCAALALAARGDAGPPKAEEFAALLAALDAIPVLDIPGDRGVVWRLFMVKQSVRTLMAALPPWDAARSPAQVLVDCTLAEAVFTAASSEIAIVVHQIEQRSRLGLW